MLKYLGVNSEENIELSNKLNSNYSIFRVQMELIDENFIGYLFVKMLNCAFSDIFRGQMERTRLRQGWQMDRWENYFGFAIIIILVTIITLKMIMVIIVEFYQHHHDHNIPISIIRNRIINTESHLMQTIIVSISCSIIIMLHRRHHRDCHCHHVVYQVRGKYGYYDPEGVLREASYGATKVVINMMVLTMRTMKIIGIWVLRLLKNIEKIRDLL